MNLPRNPFKDRTMREQFETACKVYAMQHADLFRDGERKTRAGGYGSAFARTFWDGYDNVPLRRGEKQTVGYAWYAAGRAIAKMTAHRESV